MTTRITEKQESYLLTLINRAKGKSYRFISQVTEGGIGKQANRVQGISQAQASAWIDEWKVKAAKKDD